MAAESPDLSQAHQGLLRDFLRRSDQVKFARYLPAADYITNRPKSVRGNEQQKTRQLRLGAETLTTKQGQLRSVGKLPIGISEGGF